MYDVSYYQVHVSFHETHQISIFRLISLQILNFHTKTHAVKFHHNIQIIVVNKAFKLSEVNFTLH